MRKGLTNAAPIWYNKRSGGWGGFANVNFCLVYPLFYYTIKKFLFQVLTNGFCENFTKKVLLICLTSPGVSWYNKRGIFFFFFFRKKIPRARGTQLQLPTTHPGALRRRRRTNVRFLILNSTHHYYNIKKTLCQVFS